MKKAIVIEEIVRIQHQIFVNENIPERELDYFWDEVAACDNMGDVYDMVRNRIGEENFLGINENFFEETSEIEYCEDYLVDDDGRKA